MDKKIKVAINGFGRIGRLSLRRLLEADNIDIVAINDLANPSTLLHLFKYDSVHGVFKGNMSMNDDQTQIQVNDQSINVYAEKDPNNLPWKENKIDIVIESTGRFTTKETASSHLNAGARKVIVSAPAKGGVKTIVIGVNDDLLDSSDLIVSNASCTTNCLAPMVKLLEDQYGIEKGYMSTIHAYTADQSLQDAPHKDLRRARAAAMSIIPTSTGAAAAIGSVIPSLDGKLDGLAFRVPVPDGSVVDLSVVLKSDSSVDEINQLFKEASQNRLKGILEYTEEPIVSADIVGNSHSCIFDASLTSVQGNLVKLVGWYDNEYGYASRTAELVSLLSNI